MTDKNTNTITIEEAKQRMDAQSGFQEGAFVSKNGVPALFIMSAEQRENEQASLHQLKEEMALVKLIARSQQDIAEGRTYTVEEALERLKQARS